MHPVLLHIGSFNLYTYGLFVGLGFMTAIWISQKNATHHDISSQTITDIFFIILLSALFGARFLYVLINFDAFKNFLCLNGANFYNLPIPTETFTLEKRPSKIGILETSEGSITPLHTGLGRKELNWTLTL